MRVSEICSRSVTHVGRTTKVVDAARRMRNEHVGGLVVVDEEHGRMVPIGIVTDRDLIVGVLAKDPDHLRGLDVGELLEGTVVTATEDEDLGPVLKRMRSFGVRRAPVVDARGDLVGILSIDDVIPALSDEIAEVAALVSRQPQREIKH